MKKSVLFILLSNIVLSAFAGNSLIFKHLGVEDGLSQITIRALYQDDLGVIWIGTNEDLKRYNGNSFEEVDIRLNEYESSSPVIHRITGDKKGSLFFLDHLNRVIEYSLRTEAAKVIFRSPNTNDRLAINFGRENLWITSNNKVFKYKNNKVELYHTLNLNDALITAVTETRDGSLLLGTRKNGVFSISQSKKIRHIVPECSEVVSIYEDSQQYLWVGTYSNGLFLIDKTQTITQNIVTGNTNKNISGNFVRAFCEDNNGDMWIGTSLGLDRFSRKSLDIKRYGVAKSKLEGLSHPSVWDLIKDTQGTIWVATFYGGINYFNPERTVFDFYDFSQFSENDFPVVSRITEDNNENLWVGTEGKGLFLFDKEGNFLKNFRSAPNSLSSNNIKSIYFDKANNFIWLGTHLGGLNKLDIKTKKINVINISETNRSTPNQSVQAIVPYNNYLYLATLEGIFKCDTQSLIVTQDDELKERFNVVKDLVIDDNENLWIASQGLFCFNLKTKKLSGFKDVIKYTNGSPNTLVNRLLVDSKKRIWLGTSGNGVVLFNPKDSAIVEFNVQNSGIESNYISSIFELSANRVLVGTSKGFSVIDVEKHKSFNYDSKSGFPLISMMNGDIFVRKNSQIVLGGINGICTINEDLLTKSGFDFNVRFDKIWVNNRLVKPNDDTGILTQSINYHNKIVLSHNQNMLFVEVATDNFLQKDQSNFQFKLENHNQNWVYFDARRPIRFINLRPGNYVLRVRNNVLGEDVKQAELTLEVVVRPPWYNTWYAYAIYAFLIFIVAFLIVRFYRSRLLLENSLLLERQKAEQKELANQSKLRFFTNVSHEFRTPITLITSQLELLLYSTKKTATIYKDIQNIYNSTKKITSLINELLDFRKQDQGFMLLKVSKKNVVSFVRSVYDEFFEYAKIKQVNLEFSTDSEIIDLYFDNIQLQKVFNNLISNAFKFTPKNGTISIGIKNGLDNVRITVSDTGVGISEASIQRIFERFYQDDVEAAAGNVNVGTGIGLALSKGIVDLHKAVIEVESKLGEGSTFTVVLNKGSEHFKANDKVQIIEDSSYSDVSLPKYDEAEVVVANDVDNDIEELARDSKITQTILVVEDDEDLRALLVKILSTMYHVCEAENGKTGFLMAKEILPDLIISDVMMPYVTGDEMCLKIKSDFETCHIPVILLTAQAAEEQNVAGFKSGADDYITKPFNVKLLLVRCNNLLMGRKVLMEKYTKQIDTSPKNIVHSNYDKQFIERAVEIIEKNISDKKIDIDFLCSEMAIGRRVFFSKMKAITGQTPNDFILSVKFKIAASMLKNNLELNVSEISDMLGFSSAKYFGKCFKEQFGVSPTQMRGDLSDTK